MARDLYVHKVAGGFLYYGQDGTDTMPVSNKVKAEYIKEGMAEVSEKDGVATFIKMNPTTAVPGQPLKSIKQEDNDATQKMIVRQSSLDRAVQILIARGEKEDTTKKAIAIADELTTWVMS